ncbi:MAG: ADP-ribosylglycohydrolase family protein [Pseudomonadota bacterium]
MKRPIPNSYWVIPGRLLAGEFPAAHLPALGAAGIDCYIDLTQAHELESYKSQLSAGIEYHPLPLLDHAVPDDPDAMRRILATLRKALAADRCVYVHCRAGIGRTGMAVGCWLSEESAAKTGAGTAALAELNRLWKQNARSRHWPKVPETPEQQAFVLNWHSLGSAPALPPTRAVQRQDRYLGALLGLAAGDALSVSTQGRKPGTFAVVTAPVGGGEFQLPRGAWTDDTAMALCVTESFLRRSGFDARDQMERFRLWQQQGAWSATGTAVGLRPGVRKVLALASRSRAPMLGSHDPTQLDRDPLVRCVGPALFHADDAEAAAEAGGDTARVTHQQPIVVDACRLFTAMIQAALAGERKAAILTLWRDWPGAPLKPEVLETAQQTLPRAHRATILGTLDAVLRAFAGSQDFAAGALQLANQGDDSDVAAAAYGQLAGAFLGASAIPLGWRETLAKRSDIEALAAEIFTRFDAR